MMQFIRHTLTLFVNKGSIRRERQVLIKALYEQKEYNAGQFMIKFPNRGWTKSKLLVKLRKYGTLDTRQ